MRITRKSLDIAEQQGILTAAQSQQLIALLRQLPGEQSGFNFTNALYYFGGAIAIGAMTLFMTLGWETFGGMGLFAISLGYGVIGLCLAWMFENRGYSVPAALCATFTVFTTPLAIYGLQQMLGVWPEPVPVLHYYRGIEWHWLYMELGTLAVGVVVAYLFRYPLLMLPIALSLYYLCLDLVSMLTGGSVDLELWSLFSSQYGFLMVCLAFWVDLRSRHSADHAFWLYLVGAILFSSALGCLLTDSLWERFEYFVVSLLLIFLGVVLVRRILVVCGALGTAFYLGYLASRIFLDSWLYPVALTLIGLSIILVGIGWQKIESRISGGMRQYLPAPIRELLEQRSGYL